METAKIKNCDKIEHNKFKMTFEDTQHIDYGDIFLKVYKEFLCGTLTPETKQQIRNSIETVMKELQAEGKIIIDTSLSYEMTKILIHEKLEGKTYCDTQDYINDFNRIHKRVEEQAKNNLGR